VGSVGTRHPAELGPWPGEVGRAPCARSLIEGVYTTELVARCSARVEAKPWPRRHRKPGAGAG